VPRDDRALAFARPRFPLADVSIEKEAMKAKKIKNMKADRTTLREPVLFIGNSPREKIANSSALEANQLVSLLVLHAEGRRTRSFVIRNY